MKKIIFCLAVSATVGFAGCRTTYHCRSIADMPKNLKTIDCKNYNDVTTTYWNLVQDCNEVGFNAFPCDTLLIEGWGRKSDDFIILCSDSISAVSASEDMHKNSSSSVKLYLHWGVSDLGNAEGPNIPDGVSYFYVICKGIWYRDKATTGFFRIELYGCIVIDGVRWCVN